MVRQHPDEMWKFCISELVSLSQMCTDQRDKVVSWWVSTFGMLGQLSLCHFKWLVWLPYITLGLVWLPYITLARVNGADVIHSHTTLFVHVSHKYLPCSTGCSWSSGWVFINLGIMLNFFFISMTFQILLII